MASALHRVDRACAEARDAPPSGEASTSARDAVLRAMLAFAASQDGSADPVSGLRDLLGDPSAVAAAERRDLAFAIVRALALPCLSALHDDASVRPLLARYVESTLGDVLPEDFS